MSKWDCHAHTFGPYANYPLQPDRNYTPDEAPLTSYLSLLDHLNFRHGVLVQPTAYRNDHRLLFDALRQEQQLRGVMVCQEHQLVGLLDQSKGLGIRAVRFSHRSRSVGNFVGSATIEDMQKMGSALAKFGLHAELWTDCNVLADIAHVIERFPVPVVIDHMGMFDASLGVDYKGFKLLTSLLERGKVWVKLCAYRNLLNLASPAIGLPFQQQLIHANCEQLVWGSDWPHLRVDPAPNTLSLLEQFNVWAQTHHDSSAMIKQILITNPSRLYS